MTGWSLPVGKVFGVEVRLHSFFLGLLGLSIFWAGYLEVLLLRGVVMWGLLLLALAVREAARAMAMAWFGLEVKSLLLLPTGGLLTYSSAEDLSRAGEAKVQRVLALTGPIANLVFGLTVAGLVLTVSPAVNLWAAHWVTPTHLLRTMVWMNLLLGAVNLLPAWPLDAGRVMQGQIARGGGGQVSQVAGMRLFSRIGPAIAIGLMMVGIVTANWWLIMAGFAVLLGAQVERHGMVLQTDPDTVRVADVMLTEFSVVSASATLEDALDHARHTLQDVFPVVRGGQMVGAVARQSITEALESGGNAYVQGIMTRSFQTAGAKDSLAATLSRVSGQVGASSQLVPVVDGERIVGILTPQNLQRSMRMLMRKTERGDRRTAEDESR